MNNFKKILRVFVSFINIIVVGNPYRKNYVTFAFLSFLSFIFVIFVAGCLDLAVDNDSTLEDNFLEHKGEYVVENRETNMGTGLKPIFDRNIPEILETATIGLG